MQGGKQAYCRGAGRPTAGAQVQGGKQAYCAGAGALEDLLQGHKHTYSMGTGMDTSLTYVVSLGVKVEQCVVMMACMATDDSVVQEEAAFAT